MDVAGKIIKAFGSKIFSALVVFFYHILITKYLEVREVGEYFGIYAQLLIISLFLRLGTDQYIVKIVSNQKDSENKLQNTFCLISISIVIYSLVSILLKVLGLNLNNYYILTIEITILSILSAILKGKGKINLGLIAQNGLFQLIAVIILIYNNQKININELINILEISLIISILALLTIIIKNLNRNFSIIIQKPDFSSLKEVKDYFLVSILSLLFPWTGIYVLTLSNDDFNAGILGISMRIVTLYGFLYIAVTSVLNPMISQLFGNREYKKIKRLYKTITKYLVVIACSTLAFIIFFADIILKIFGEEYLEAKMLIIILCIGQAINIATGPTTTILTMCSQVEKVRRNAIISGFILISFSYIGYELYSIIGICYAYSLAMISNNFLNFRDTRIVLKGMK